MSLTNIKQIQDRLLNIALEITSILEKHEIPHFIGYGTLLGAVRHQGFIPWDDDFDFFLFDDSYEEAINVLRKELNQNYFVEDKLTEENFFHGWSRVKDLNSVVSYKEKTDDSIYRKQGLTIDLFRAYYTSFGNLNQFMNEQKLSYLNRKLKHGIISENEYNVS